MGCSGWEGGWLICLGFVWFKGAGRGLGFGGGGEGILKISWKACTARETPEGPMNDSASGGGWGGVGWGGVGWGGVGWGGVGWGGVGFLRA